MAPATLKRILAGNTPVIFLLALLFISLYLMSGATTDSALFGRLYLWLLLINIAAILLLVGIIGRHVYQLVQRYREQATGSRLTSRLVVMFIILSLTPVSVVYYFSLDFLRRGIDSWFDVRVENALKDSLELSQASMGVRMQELLHKSQEMSQRLVETSNDLAAITLNDLRTASGADELTLFTASGRIIASSSFETASLIPHSLHETTILRLRQGEDDVALVPLSEHDLHISTAVRVLSPDPVVEYRVLQALYPVTERINTLANSVQSAFSNYSEIAYLRTPLKYSFILTLSLVLMLSILAAIWGAFFFARRLVAPITDLVEGTRAVAEGNYDKRLPLPGKDELGFLVRSFNEMTRKIALANDTAKHSQQQVEQQNAYLEVVLAHLSSGVLTLDSQLRVHTSNTAASQILNIDLLRYRELPLSTLVHEQPQMHFFVDVVEPHIQADDVEWREEITLFGSGGRQVLMCRGTLLPHTVTLEGGHMIVFDDITTLLQAQRNAAWGEVARRLAHEIKNPLTPIQLSAERLRHKFLDVLPPKDAELLDRSTHTIVQQVETLKTMVKAFSDYARMPTLQVQQINLNDLVNEVLDLYRSEHPTMLLEVNLDHTRPQIEGDAGRLRQILHNLIKNAQEAMENTKDARLCIRTRCMEQQACRFVELRIEDNGPGISPEIFAQLFEPYITSKLKGSGLGLAIVKKIVEEHGGMVWAENLTTGGACIIIRLPVRATERYINSPEQDDHDTSHVA